MALSLSDYSSGISYVRKNHISLVDMWTHIIVHRTELGMGEEDSEGARYIQMIKHCKLYICPLFFCGLSFSLGHSIQVDCPIIPHINHVDPKLCLGCVYDTLYSPLTLYNSTLHVLSLLIFTTILWDRYC